MSAINRLHRTYKDRITFYLVYIREAHPLGSRRPDRRLRIDEPTTLLERAGVASTCQADLGIELPVLVDDLKDSAERAYAAWPDRLFLIDTAGEVAWRSGPGPRGFDVAAWGEAIAKLAGPKPAAPAGEEPVEATQEEIRERLEARRRRQLEEAEEE